tara:strand:- start:337 stop:759 length:423 start_codon:yes stop_codon:yes gene_type:complete
MELEIAEKNDNPLLSRQEVQIVIRHENESTPRRSEVIQNLSEKMKAKKDLIIIDHLKNKYGKMESQGYAKIYENVEALTRIETKPSIARQKNAKQAKPEAPKKKEAEERNESVEEEESSEEDNSEDEKSEEELTEKENTD